MDLGQGTGCFRGFDAETTAGVVEVEEDAAVFFGDGRQGAGDEFGAIAGDGAEDVAGEAVRMDAHERGSWPFEVAADKRDVLIVVDVAGVGDDAEIAEARGENGFGHTAYVTLV